MSFKIFNLLKAKLIRYRPFFPVFLIFCYLIWNRLYLIWNFGDRAFGYDTGIYRRLIYDYFHHLGATSASTPFAFCDFSSALLALGSSIDFIMYGWYFIIALGTGVLLYIIIKKWFNPTAATWAFFLFSTSLVQFEFYKWYYYRNLLALFFVLLALNLWEHRSYLTIFPLVLIGSIHPPSFIPLGLSFALYGLWERKDRKRIFVVLGITALVITLLNWKELIGYLSYLDFANGHVPLLKNYQPAESSEFTGQFIDFAYFWKAVLWYLPFAVVGFFYVYKRRPVITIFSALVIFLIAIGFVLYRRYFVYLDLALIIFSAGWVGELYAQKPAEKLRWPALAAAVVFAVFLLVRSAVQAFSASPLISQQEFLALENTKAVVGSNYLVALSSYYAPWLYGFSGHDIIAPGMFDVNEWSREEWNKFWDSEDPAERKKMLAQYGKKDLYFFMGLRDRWLEPSFEKDKSFVRLNDYLWQYHF